MIPQIFIKIRGGQVELFYFLVVMSWNNLFVFSPTAVPLQFI